VIFVLLDVSLHSLAVNLCINCSFFAFAMIITSDVKKTQR